MDSDIKFNVNSSDDPNVTLTIRFIMQGKEVGSIIGKKGEIVNRFREESGAKINISDGSCPERIVTVTGPTQSIYKAFTLICKKFEEFVHQFQELQNGGGSRSPITLRLIVPASQCGSLIGKGGSKIKEIREVTGASIQVASDMLPNSTERAVTITGTSEAITQCIYHICQVMLESPPKGATIPYRPKPQVAAPVILAGGQAYTIQGNYAVPAHGEVSTLGPGGPHGAGGGGGGVPWLPPPTAAHLFPGGLVDPLLKTPHLAGALPPAHLTAAHTTEMGKMAGSPLAGLAALGLGGLSSANTGGLNPAALAALAGSQLRTNTANNRNQPQGGQQTHEMTVPNDLIGCIIGKGGTKIAEIRQISGAMIRISNCEEREGGSTDRTITISGSSDSVQLAQYLINMSVELQKANLEGASGTAGGTGGSSSGNGNGGGGGNGSSGGGGGSSGGSGGGGGGGGGGSSSSTTASSSVASALPLAQLLTKPGALNALTSLTALSGLTDLLGGLAGTPGAPIQTTGVHRNKPFTPRLRSPGNSGQSEKLKSERNKFAPY